MRPALASYIVVALLAAAMVGPVTEQVRNASLGEIERVGTPRPLTDYPFLLATKDHLPPLIVDWVIASRTEGIPVPAGAKLHIDPDGRFTLEWGDGCRETYREGQDARGTECGGSWTDDPASCQAHQVHADNRCIDVCRADEAYDPVHGTCEGEPPACPPGEAYAKREEPGGPGCVPDPRCDTSDDADGSFVGSSNNTQSQS